MIEPDPIERDLSLPGSKRYQPKCLKPIFGYDNLYTPLVEVELALLDELHASGIIPASDYALLTPGLRADLLSITTTEVDEIESNLTHHDIRALVQAMQKRMPPEIKRWVHLTATSYDILEPARILQLKRAYKALEPEINRVIEILARRANEEADTIMIGRTHGQHALPITAGFWLATILSRVLHCAGELARAEKHLHGKFSGAVGARNAHVALGLNERKSTTQGVNMWYGQYVKGGFENQVLHHLGLTPAMTSTQILPPEPTASFLFNATLLSAVLGQFGRDCRQLARTEIGEIAEPFEKGQVGSSTMAQKRNPLTFEQFEGMWIRTEAEFGKVMRTLISEHQRDLVGSTVVRDFPMILVNLAQQLSRLLKVRKSTGKTFLESIVIDREACKRNFKMQSHLVTAEPLYIALAMHGFPGDAHEFVNHEVVPRAKDIGVDLWVAALDLTKYVDEVSRNRRKVLDSIPESMKEVFRDPAKYTGESAHQARSVARAAFSYLRKEW